MRIRAFITTLVFGIMALTVAAQDASTLRKKQYNLDDDIAIMGYDPVAYFIIKQSSKR